ncbi:MAG: hypothetical protein RR310_08570 [Eubacterium sp.]
MSRTRADVVVRIRPRVITVSIKDTSIRRVVPIAAPKRDTKLKL